MSQDKSLREKIIEIIVEFGGSDGDRSVRLAEQMAYSIIQTVLDELPEWKPAHTYASENAGEYHAYDTGFKQCLTEIKSKLK